MATKEEILNKLKDGNKNIQTLSSFYQFDEGDVVTIEPPKNPQLLDKKITELLATDNVSEKDLPLAAMLYHKTLSDLTEEQKQRISGKISIDDNLFSEANQNSATAASAAFVPLEEKICVRQNLFVGSEIQIAEDIICILHETRHYRQFLTTPEYKRTLDGKQSGTRAEHIQFRIAYSRFKDRIIDQKSTEERQKNDYAVYFQNPEEVDVRDYSLQYAQQIVDSALKSPDLTQQNKVWLEGVKHGIAENKNKVDEIDKQTLPRFLQIKSQVEHLAKQTQEMRNEILTPDNIASLEHYNERDPFTENLRQYLFDLEYSLCINYNEEIAQQIQDIVTKYKVYALGRELVVNPNFKPSEEFLDIIIESDIGIFLGHPSICPPYDKDQVLERYAEIKAKSESEKNS